eukprot:Hpha_TRINITY_DN15078_c8_g2::TRINITY_DN15078_c8_g2_i3::g.123701::m.123701
MGNKMAGYGLLNETDVPVTVGLSMGGYHYYENSVLPGEIFYRWPGAVHYTITCFPTGDDTYITDGSCVSSTIMSSVAGIATAAATLATMGAASVVAAGAVTGTTVCGVVVSGSVLSAVYAAAGIVAVIGELWGGSETNEKLQQWLCALGESQLYVSKAGFYGGGSGSWVVLKGGPQDEGDNYAKMDFKLEVTTSEEIFKRGVFTPYSKKCFYTRDDLPEPPQIQSGKYQNPTWRSIERKYSSESA